MPPARNRDGGPRDTQRARVYAAEDVLAGLRVSAHARRCLIDTETNASQTGRLPDGTPVLVPYPSVAAAQAYVDAVRTSAPFRRRWGHISLTVGSNASASRGGDGVVELSAAHRRSEAVILHEIAHNLLTHRPGRHGQFAAHGPEFAATLLELVRVVMGAESARRLRASFTAHRVRYRPGPGVVPKPSAARLARAQGVRVRVTAPPAGPARAPVPVRTRKRREVVGYDASYEKGFRSGENLTDLDVAEGRFARNHPNGDLNAWMDGWLDGAAGRQKWHLRECTSGRIECDEHQHGTAEPAAPGPEDPGHVEPADPQVS